MRDWSAQIHPTAATPFCSMILLSFACLLFSLRGRRLLSLPSWREGTCRRGHLDRVDSRRRLIWISDYFSQILCRKIYFQINFSMQESKRNERRVILGRSSARSFCAFSSRILANDILARMNLLSLLSNYFQTMYPYHRAYSWFLSTRKPGNGNYLTLGDRYCTIPYILYGVWYKTT